jgi:hypothetical protein
MMPSPKLPTNSRLPKRPNPSGASVLGGACAFAMLLR